MNFEICIDSVQSAINAQLGGAQRVELCDNLFEGGTTPSAGMIKQVRKAIDIQLFVIIRPRGGDFLVSPDELEVMLEDIRIAKDLGADGIVSGALTADGNIDLETTDKLIKAANPLPFTFHRAFDMCKDAFLALEQLINLGVTRILTSGQQPNALSGADTIKELINKAADKIIIMPGAGINPDNIKSLIEKTGSKEYHFSGRKQFSSGMIYKNTMINMGGIPGIPEYSLFYSDVNIIKSVIRNAKAAIHGKEETK
ncbi:copper homeostasis protein CutC [Marinilabiliaceae bacterium JC017]|nr:copper homeostasis protein CutC [Marinilabiliaceae bacterium JC017]